MHRSWSRDALHLLGCSQISTGAANFMSGGLGSFVFWAMAIPFDNVKYAIEVVKEFRY